MEDVIGSLLQCVDLESTSSKLEDPHRLLDLTSAVRVATKAREVGGTLDCTPQYSIKSFLLSALMSCSTESSRTESRVMVVVVIPRGVRHSFRAPS